jgi:hypothetical protein
MALSYVYEDSATREHKITKHKNRGHNWTNKLQTLQYHEIFKDITTEATFDPTNSKHYLSTAAYLVIWWHIFSISTSRRWKTNANKFSGKGSCKQTSTWNGGSRKPDTYLQLGSFNRVGIAPSNGGVFVGFLATTTNLQTINAKKRKSAYSTICYVKAPTLVLNGAAHSNFKHTKLVSFKSSYYKQCHCAIFETRKHLHKK